jgi:hypothetical protein
LSRLQRFVSRQPHRMPTLATKLGDAEVAD